jgi:phosphoglycerol transferase MdoB-like AlkP superfamily enzyme
MNLLFILFLYLTGFVILGLERLIFALWNWSLYKQFGFIELISTFIAGLRFDWVALSICIAIPVLVMLPLSLLVKPLTVRRVGLLLFSIIFVALNTLNIVDIEFFNFMGRRFTIEALFLLREVPGKTSEIVLFYWNLALLWIFLSGLTLILMWRARNPFVHRFVWPKTKTGQTLTSVALLLFVVVGARGGLQTKPINFVHAQLFAVPALNTLTMNTIFTFTQNLKREPLPREKFFEDSEEMFPYLNGSLGAFSWLEGQRPRTAQNVMIIVLESFNFENMGIAHGDAGYTPFLDELSQKGILFRQAYANGRRSIEGIGAVVGGVPSLMAEPFISSQYMTNNFYGLGTLVRKKNYHSAFFHGAQNGTMYFDRFMISAGIKNYFGLNEYPRPEETDGTWGIWDEPFFLWTVDQINDFPEGSPFLAVLFSLTSHHPYKIPAEYKGKFAEGSLDIHRSIQYTDMAVRKFFDKASKQAWFKDTLFIITADHTYKTFRPQYDNDIGKYRIPFIMYHPSMSFNGVDADQVVSHVDILPTVVDFLDLPMSDANYLGQSVFVPGDRTAINFNDGRYYLAARDYFMEYMRGGGFRMFSVNDPSQSQPLTEPADRFETLKKKTQAHIQYFNEGLWDNRLYYPVQ